MKTNNATVTTITQPATREVTIKALDEQDRKIGQAVSIIGLLENKLLEALEVDAVGEVPRLEAGELVQFLDTLGAVSDLVEASRVAPV